MTSLVRLASPWDDVQRTEGGNVDNWRHIYTVLSQKEQVLTFSYLLSRSAQSGNPEVIEPTLSRHPTDTIKHMKGHPTLFPF